MKKDLFFETFFKSISRVAAEPPLRSAVFAGGAGGAFEDFGPKNGGAADPFLSWNMKKSRTTSGAGGAFQLGKKRLCLMISENF